MQFTHHFANDESNAQQVTQCALWSERINSYIEKNATTEAFDSATVVPKASFQSSLDGLVREFGPFDYRYQDGNRANIFWRSWGVMLCCNDRFQTSFECVTRQSDKPKVERAIAEYFKLWIPKEEKEGYLACDNNGSLYLASDASYYLGAPLERGNYNEDVLAVYDRVVADFKKNQPMGRLALFSGVPGSGKTFLMKGLMDELEGSAKVVLLSAALAGKLGDPDTLTAFLRSNRDRSPMVIVIEDGDHLLVPREKGSLPVISTILQATDGLLGQLLNLRIVITTNAKNEEWDAAFMRKMRLSGCIKVNELHATTSNNIYKRLTGRDAPQYYTTLADAYYAAISSGLTPTTSDDNSTNEKR